MLMYILKPSKNISATTKAEGVNLLPAMRQYARFNTNRQRNRQRQKETPHKLLVCKGFSVNVEVPSGFEPL